MKAPLICLFIFLLLPVISFAQDDIQEKGPHKKLEKLEQIKLMEALKMNEETSVRFFARQGENRRKMRDMEKQSREMLVKINKNLDDKSDKNNSELKKSIDEYLKITVQIQKERMNFINSLSDILSTEQIARLLVFEKNFRDEIRNIIFKEKFKDRK